MTPAAGRVTADEYAPARRGRVSTLRWGPDSVGVFLTGLRHAPERELHPLERELLDAVPPVRRSGFVDGRRAAASALGMLGRPGPVLRDGRLPLFPPGVRGSISHCPGGTAAGLVTRDPHVEAVGVDVERVGRLSAVGARRILTDGERLRLPAGVAGERLATVVFSAKEALYKSVTPLGPARAPSFGDVEVSVEGANLHLALAPDVLPTARVFLGRVRFIGPYVWTSVLVL